MKRKKLSEDGRTMFHRVMDSVVKNTWFGPGTESTRNPYKRKLTIKTPDGKKYVLRFEEIR